MQHDKQNKSVNTGNLYVEILRWTYSKKINGFSEKELFEEFGLGQDELLKNWYLNTFRGGRHNDDCIIGIFPDLKNNTHYLSLTAKGLVAAIDYLGLEEARENSIKSNKQSTHAFYVSVASLIISVFIGVVAICFQIQSNALTREDVELSASPVLDISLDKRDIPKNSNETNEVTIASGWLSAKDSILKLILTNFSISSVEDVDMRMTLWKYFIDEESRHLNVCPLGYVDHKNNPNFIIDNIHTDNLFNKKFSLNKGDEYPFSINLSGLKNEKIDFKILLKIDVNFVKSSGQTKHSYIKLYVLNSLDQVIDVDIAPEFGLMLNDKKNEKEIDGFKFPSTVYSFQEKEFLNYFENPTYKLDLQPNNCREFVLSKEQKVISY